MHLTINQSTKMPWQECGFHSRDETAMLVYKTMANFCITIESNCQKTLFVIVLFTNMAKGFQYAPTSDKERRLLRSETSVTFCLN